MNGFVAGRAMHPFAFTLVGPYVPIVEHKDASASQAFHLPFCKRLSSFFDYSHSYFFLSFFTFKVRLSLRK